MTLRSVRRVAVAASVAGLATVFGAVPLATGVASATGGGGVVPLGIVAHTVPATTGPPASATCIATFTVACYTPQDIRHEYTFTGAYAKGYTGAGQTIVIFDSFGSPTIANDLATFDSTYGIPAPPSFSVYQPEGKVVYTYVGKTATQIAHSRHMQTQIGWAYETTLDVEWSHAMAPGASIALVVTPIPETQGVQGLQNLVNAQAWVLSHHIGTIWSNSWATTEQAFHNPQILQQLNQLYAKAAADGVSAFFAAGDTGALNSNKQGTPYPYATVEFPSSSPDVVSVGGTEIPTLMPKITSYVPESVWNDGYGAGGGGYSVVFPEPGFQSSASIPDPTAMRGLPDVSYNAAVISAVLTYNSFLTTSPPFWAIIGGTSAATPQWAAVDAIANQAAQKAGTSLGFLPPRLYQLYGTATAYAASFHDITSGTNSFGGVTGYSATKGWDPASGLGTPDVSNLVTALMSTTP